MMITCNLCGGLGNQLFQIFTTISYAIKSKKKFYFLDSEISPSITKRYTFWNSLLYKLKPFLVESVVQDSKIIKQADFTFNEIEISELMDNNNICLEGYFQSYKYFQSYYDTIYKMLDIDKQKKTILPLSNLENTISLHFRLGDYKALQWCHPIMTYEYYKKAISFIQNKDTTVRNVFFFCEEEDIETVMVTVNLLIKDFHNLFFIRASNSLSDWEQMLLMSCCNHNIIANSSFSWWGAYFNSNPNKIVCYPETWFGPTIPESTKTQDLCPMEWNKMEIL
jgi:hypothetical protein